jgi:hypothetical protein
MLMVVGGRGRVHSLQVDVSRSQHQFPLSSGRPFPINAICRCPSLHIKSAANCGCASLLADRRDPDIRIRSVQSAAIRAIRSRPRGSPINFPSGQSPVFANQFSAEQSRAICGCISYSGR